MYAWNSNKNRHYAYVHDDVRNAAHMFICLISTVYLRLKNLFCALVRLARWHKMLIANAFMQTNEYGYVRLGVLLAFQFGLCVCVCRGIRFG